MLGDFNSILEEDRLGQNVVTSYETRDFINCSVDLGLEDISYSGVRYTWTNGHTWSMIDRAMCYQK